jgi:hypothetical protein
VDVAERRTAPKGRTPSIFRNRTQKGSQREYLPERRSRSAPPCEPRLVSERIPAITEPPEPPQEPPEEPNGEPEEPPQAEIIIQPEQLAGVWSNWAQASYGEHEFTIDFVRVDPLLPRGIVVARVSGSATFIMQLIDTLNAVWHDWAKKAMPPEVHEDEDEPETPENRGT